MFRGPEGREWRWDQHQLGVWSRAVSSSSGVWGRAPAEIEFGAFLALKSDIRWQQFRLFSMQCRPQTSKSKIFGEAMPLIKSAYAGASLHEPSELQQLALNFLMTFLVVMSSSPTTVIHLHAPRKLYPTYNMRPLSIREAPRPGGTGVLPPALHALFNEPKMTIVRCP